MGLQGPNLCGNDEVELLEERWLTLGKECRRSLHIAGRDRGVKFLKKLCDARGSTLSKTTGIEQEIVAKIRRLDLHPKLSKWALKSGRGARIEQSTGLDILNKRVLASASSTIVKAAIPPSTRFFKVSDPVGPACNTQTLAD